MRQDHLAPNDHFESLKHELSMRYHTHAFLDCETMGDLTAARTELPPTCR